MLRFGVSLFSNVRPGLTPRLGVTCGLSLLVLCNTPRGFSPGIPVFLTPEKPAYDLISAPVLNTVDT